MKTYNITYEKNISYLIEQITFSVILTKADIDRFECLKKFIEDVYINEPSLTEQEIMSLGVEIYYDGEKIDKDALKMSFNLLRPYQEMDIECIETVFNYLAKIFQIEVERFYITNIRTCMVFDVPPDDAYDLIHKLTRFSYYCDRNLKIDYAPNALVGCGRSVSTHNPFLGAPIAIPLYLHLDSHYRQVDSYIQKNALSSAPIKEKLLNFLDYIQTVFFDILEAVEMNK